MLEPVHLSRSEPILTAVVKGRVASSELSRFVPAACGEVWSFIRAGSLPNPGRHIALYLDTSGLVEVGAEVTAPFTGNDRIHCSGLPSGPVATITHFGPYSGLHAAHSAIRRWCADHGHALTNASWEIYGHWDQSWNEDPSRIRTDVFYLLEET